MKKAKEELEKLSTIERDYLLLSLLVEGKLDFTHIATLYISSLQSKNKDKQINIAGLAYMLSSSSPNIKNKEQKAFIKAKSAYHLLKSGMFHAAPIEKEYIKTVKDYNYKEDENGDPLININL